MTEVLIIHPYGKEVKATVVPDRTCPPETIYILQPNEYTGLPNNYFLNTARTMHQIEKDRSEWIRKYDNAMNGLKYWKSKAAECD